MVDWYNRNELKQNRSNTNVWLPLALSIMLAIGMMFGYVMNEKDEAPLISMIDDDELIAAPIGQVEELVRFVETRYVDTIKRDELLSEAIHAILQKLDPHSVYIPKEKLERINQDMQGSFNGIGIESFYIDDTVNIVRTLSGSPAQDAGVLSFDKILSINGENVAGQKIPFEDIQKKIQLRKGDKISLELLGKDNVKRVQEVIVDAVPIKSVDLATNITDEIGYIKINRFSSTTYKEFMDHFEKMYESKTKHLIIDLRGNPGGYMPQATNILSQLFAEKGNLLVYTEGRKKKKNEYKTTGKPFFTVDKIVVLIDENSASASEIIAGAIQDWDRGIVIGRRSFGKGLVQEQYSLSNGGAIRLTVARYYTPTGRSIQKSYTDIEHYDEDLFDRIHRGALYHRDSLLSDTVNYPIYKTLKLQREVGGRGGISPDVFVPVDSLDISYTYQSLLMELPEYVFRYVRDNKVTNVSEKIVSDIASDYAVKMDIRNQIYLKQLRKDIRIDLTLFLENKSKAYSNMLDTDPYIEKGKAYIEGDIKLKGQ